MKLNGLTALVTGGGRGIGEAIVLALAAEGANVVVADVRKDVAEEAAAKAREKGVKSIAVEVDVTNEEAVKSMVKAAVDEFGGLDIAVNNAGILNINSVETMSSDDWDKVLGVNAKGVFLSTKYELEVMRPKKFGRIINTASMAGKLGFPDLSHYVASKFAVVGFTRSVAKEVAPIGITVNAVCPGIVGTGMWRGNNGLAKAWAHEGETEEQSWNRQTKQLLPQQTAQTEEDIAQAVVFLASAPHITGQALSVDGGATA